MYIVIMCDKKIKQQQLPTWGSPFSWEKKKKKFSKHRINNNNNKIAKGQFEQDFFGCLK